MVNFIKLNVQDIPGQSKMKLVELAGALDSPSSKKLEEALGPIANEAGMNIILDCEKLNYINTVGMITLMKYCVKAKRSKGTFKLIKINKNIREVLDLSGALKILEIYTNLDEVIKSIG